MPQVCCQCVETALLRFILLFESFGGFFVFVFFVLSINFIPDGSSCCLKDKRYETFSSICK